MSRGDSAKKRRTRRLPAGELQIALVGAGTALHAMYGPAFRFLEGARLTCVMDPWDEARRWARKRHGVKTYATLGGMIRHGRPHVAIVASPTAAHAAQVVRLARAGIHVFCEKPMARSLQECDAMIRACAEGGVALGIGFMKRTNTSVALATDLVRRRKLGRLFEMDCEWSFPASSPPERYAHPHRDWRGEAENWGGVFQDHGSHTIDLARLWLGEIRTVSAEMRILNPGQHVEDVAAVMCRHDGGRISTHRMNIRTHKPLRERYELFGSKGTLELEWGGVWRWSAYTAEPMNLRIHRRGREIQVLTPRPEQSIDLEMEGHWHYLAELRSFLQALREDRKPPLGGEAGRAVVEVVTAAYLSATTSRTIHLPLDEPVDLERIFTRGELRG